jgi:hypothetical protein
MVLESIPFGLKPGDVGRRGEMPERNSSISEAEWARGRRSRVDSSRKVPCPVKKQNLKGRSDKMGIRVLKS